jgi:diguanylate cyclase (GGDEF)-like protein
MANEGKQEATSASYTPAARQRVRPAKHQPQDHDHRRVLLIESSPATAKVVRQEIAARCHRETLVIATLAEASALLNAGREEFLAAVVALELIDATGTESAQLTISFGLPTIVLTATWTPELRRRIWELDVYDYYVKRHAGLVAVCRALTRLPRNQRTKVLVVDDSSTYRNVQSRLLRAHHFEVLLASDGTEALALLEKDLDILLVITDYEMPGMSGVELVQRLRDKRAADDLAILAISGTSKLGTSVEFLKQGASDFIPKRFEKEEYYCRVYNCLATVETAREIKRIAYTDALTGLWNRLYFFSTAPKDFAAARAANTKIAVAMLDLDFFKQVNDTHGHAAGDAVLRHVARLAQTILGDRVLLARFGGEEFCAFARGLPEGDAETLCERLRATLASSTVEHEGKLISTTMSIGLVLGAEEDLDSTINTADRLLYRAKHDGRNRVVVGHPAEPRAGFFP